MKFYSCVHKGWGRIKGSGFNINGHRLKVDIETMLERDLHSD
jgi:hypothetical protein